jgi:predicted Fe-S protein YdhL (DUF1289 family)
MSEERAAAAAVQAGLGVDADADVPSPCIGVCALDPRSGWCEGCLRTIDEIAAWGALDAAGKREVCGRLPARRAARVRSKAESEPEPRG